MPVWTMNLPTPQGRGQPCGFVHSPHWRLTRPPWTGKLPTVGFALPGRENSGEAGFGTCPPLHAGWWGVGAWGKLRPSREGHDWELSPRCRTEPGPSHRGPSARQKHRAAVFMDLLHPSPGHGFKPLGWRSGRVSRCNAYCTQGQPGTSSTEGDKSEEAVPVLWLTFNRCRFPAPE